MAPAEGDKHESAGGLWEGILNEVHTEASLSDKTLVMLGRPGIGKRTLCHALMSHASPSLAADSGAEISSEGHSRAVGLDYAYFGSRDPTDVDAASAPDYRCPAATSVLILEDVKFEKVLRSRLTVDSLKHLCAVICLDLKQPWTMMEDLRQFLELLQRLMSDLLQQMPLAAQDELRDRLAKYVAGYQEEHGDGSGVAALVFNMCVPIVVVVTRSDTASALDSQKTLGWSETIEAYLRSECLSYGAAIVYTMARAKNTRNVDVLYQYLMHRLYGYALRAQPNSPSRDALFIPSGWDSQAKVDQAAAQLPGGGGLERAFESVVTCMEPPPPQPPPLEECEEMQQFLKRNSAVLQKLGGVSATSARRAAPGMPTDPASVAGADKSKEAAGARRSVRTEGGASVGVGAAAVGGVPAATDNASLANFFQNLLTRGQGGDGRSSLVSNVSNMPAPAVRASTMTAAQPAAVPAAPAVADAGDAAAEGESAGSPQPAVSFQVPKKCEGSPDGAPGDAA